MRQKSSWIPRVLYKLLNNIRTSIRSRSLKLGSCDEFSRVLSNTMHISWSLLILLYSYITYSQTMNGQNAFEQYVSVLTTEYIENRMSYYCNVRREYYTGRKWWLYTASLIILWYLWVSECIFQHRHLLRTSNNVTDN